MKLKRFQFPLSERTNCNCRPRVCIRHIQNLSVSSIGTNELQQLPRPSRVVALILPFSFLYRNERTATPRTLTRVISSLNFQFPLSERTNCNKEAEANKTQRTKLSVSSIGTNELQLHENLISHVSLVCFQFPLSERTNCNVVTPEADSIINALSVSSIGTNELQHCAGYIHCASDMTLSVSSIGTNELQPVDLFTSTPVPTAFSFLYRNERTATKFDSETILSHISFSFLYRNERTATPLNRNWTFFLITFQFPLSERTNCNFHFLTMRLEKQQLSVSSIGTNELQRNHFRETLSNFATFSFLYRNERTATLGILLLLGTHVLLSVSSIGTNELQLFSKKSTCVKRFSFSFLYRNERTATKQRRPPNDIPIYLSVSSIGTNELQRSSHSWRRNILTSFSFLYRNERTATEIANAGLTNASNAFSFLYRNERTATVSPQTKTD